MIQFRKWLAWISCALACLLGGGAVAEQPKPLIEVVFLDRDDKVLNRQEVSMEMLLSLPEASFETTTVWTEGIQQFRGVWLADLMDYLNITEGEIYLSALNEYLVEFPLSEMERGGPLVAYERNHGPMSPRDKGPLWVVFPYDSDEKYQTESVFAQSVWQMDRIEVYR